MTEMERIAALIAIEAAPRQNKHSSHAYVSWPLINALREELGHRGLDWKELRHKTEEIKKQRMEKAS